MAVDNVEYLIPTAAGEIIECSDDSWWRVESAVSRVALRCDVGTVLTARNRDGIIHVAPYFVIIGNRRDAFRWGRAYRAPFVVLRDSMRAIPVPYGWHRVAAWIRGS